MGDGMLLRIIIFLILGLLLFGANVLFVQAIRSTFFDRSTPSQIAPFRVIGRENKDGVLSIAMAHELRARVGLLLRELQEPDTQFDQSRFDKTYQPLGIPLRQVEVPDRIFEPLDITLNLSGVELGGVFSRLHNLITSPTALDFVVEFQDDQAIVAGNLDLMGGAPLYAIARPPTTDEIVTVIAYAIYQRQLAAKISHVSALDLPEFRSLISHLLKAVQLNRKVLRQTVTEKDYHDLLIELREFIDKLPQWQEFVHLTAEVAKNAKAPAEALSLYRRELALLDEDSPTYSEVEDQINRLEVSVHIASTEPVVPQDDSAAVLKRLRESTWGRSLLSKLNLPTIPEGVVTSSPTIAILGSLPSHNLLTEAQRTYLRGEKRGAEANYEEQFTNNLVRLILMIAPQAHFTFTSIKSSYPGGGYLESDIVDALYSLLDSSPDILLITYGPFYGDLLPLVINEATDQGTVVVMAASADIPGYEQYPIEIYPNTITVAGLTNDNRPVEPLPQNYNKQQLYWVPAQDLPILTSGGKIEPGSSNSYAAALVAGITWHIKVAARDITPGEVFQTLSDNSKLVGDALPVINASGTLNELQQRSKGLRLTPKMEENKLIPDNDPNGLNSVISISETGTIIRIKAMLNIDHTYIGDLSISLQSPDGKKFVLHDRQGGSKDNLIKTYSQELDKLIGTSFKGDWVLHVEDHTAQDTGRLNWWSLDIQYAE